jgi:hypothetical protein
VHALEKHDPVDFAYIERATVIAANGNYRAAWDNDYSLGFQDHAVKQASTMSPAISPSDSDLDLAFAPTAVARGGGAPEMLACAMSSSSNIDNGDPVTAAHLNDHVHFSRHASDGIYDDRTGKFQRTALTGSTPPKAVRAITGTRAAFVANKNGPEQEWLRDSAGAFSAMPTDVLSAAPVPVHSDQIIDRSGKLIRIFIHDDGKVHGGRRLLEQIQH